MKDLRLNQLELSTIMLLLSVGVLHAKTDLTQGFWIEKNKNWYRDIKFYPDGSVKLYTRRYEPGIKPRCNDIYSDDIGKGKFTMDGDTVQIITYNDKGNIEASSTNTIKDGKLTNIFGSLEHSNTVQLNGKYGCYVKESDFP